MLSFGVALVGAYDGDRFSKVEPGSVSIYKELKPISRRFDLEALQVNGLDRERLFHEGEDPQSALSHAAEWITEKAANGRPVLVAYPVAFDWSFMYWYFEHFSTSGSPFGHSSCLDIRTLYQAVSGTVFDESGKSEMPRALLPDLPHTHNALDDAVEQGELFANLFAWSIRRRNEMAHTDISVTRGESPTWLSSHVDPFSTRRR